MSRLLVRGRGDVDVLKIDIVTLTEMAPKIVDEIHTIIRRIAIWLSPPYLWSSGGIVIDADELVKKHSGL